ncbi:MAG: polyphosphate polymerase domain-containing protein [Propionibacteriaceae bacterium]|jgi:hypothetical protein|nr:polyphosphate polymerase domain-containing protein [Propionibacteriaceae bacterium]
MSISMESLAQVQGLVLPDQSQLPGVSLTELNQRAALLARTDRKYMLTIDRARALLADLPEGAKVLDIAGQRQFHYQSVYYDTGDFLCYQLAAHQRRHRFKVRARRYCDSGEQWLEVKTRGLRGQTVKDRLPIGQAQIDRPTGLAIEGAGRRDWVATTLAGRGVEGAPVDRLVPTLQVDYDRITLLLPDGSRCTIDQGMAWQALDSGRDETVPSLVIVETKTAAHISDIDHWLWRHGSRPARISKYASGLALLYSFLGANRWHRTLMTIDDMD